MQVFLTSLVTTSSIESDRFVQCPVVKETPRIHENEVIVQSRGGKYL